MSLTLLDWRRTVAVLYARVRAEPDPRYGWSLWCEGRDRLFTEHPDSPLPTTHPARTAGLRYAPYDPSLRWELPVQPAPAERWEVPTGSDGVVPFERFGSLDLPGLGSLDVWWLDSYGGGVFVPLRDGGAGADSYGGGRYLLDSVKGADLGGSGDRLVVDLNFAYNPSCAYDPAWACPLAPEGNRLSTAVRAGELLPAVGR